MKKRVLLIMFTAILLLAFNFCTNDKSSNRDLAQKQEGLMQEANRQVGMPAIKNFQERKLMKMIFELRDQENLVCYAYLWNEFNGKLVYIGKCMGYGLPYATQFTNPSQITNRYGSSDVSGMSELQVLPQSDPNGLFMPSSAAGTWLMMIDPVTNDPHPVYIEPNVIVSPFKLQ